jgi:hypothetical protein
LLVFAFLTRLLPPQELIFIDYHNHELAGGTIFIHGTIVPYWKDAVGLGSFVCHTKSKKNGQKSWSSCRWGTLHQRDPLALQRLKEAAEKAKKELSSTHQNDINLH